MNATTDTTRYPDLLSITRAISPIHQLLSQLRLQVIIIMAEITTLT